MVQRKYCAVILLAGQTQVDGRFTAVAADFQYRPDTAAQHCVVIEGLGFILGEKALDVVDVCWKSLDHNINLVAGLRQGKVAVLAVQGKYLWCALGCYVAVL